MFKNFINKVVDTSKRLKKSILRLFKHEITKTNIKKYSEDFIHSNYYEMEYNDTLKKEGFQKKVPDSTEFELPIRTVKFKFLNKCDDKIVENGKLHSRHFLELMNRIGERSLELMTHDLENKDYIQAYKTIEFDKNNSINLKKIEFMFHPKKNNGCETSEITPKQKKTFDIEFNKVLENVKYNKETLPEVENANEVINMDNDE